MSPTVCEELKLASSRVGELGSELAMRAAPAGTSLPACERP